MNTKNKETNEEFLEEEHIQSGENVSEETENAADATQQQEAEETESCIEKDLDEARTLCEDLKDKYLRLSAEFDNFRKRTMKEKAELILNGGEKTIVSILPVLDDLERAISTMGKAESVEALTEGVELIYQKFLKTLAQNGVQVIQTEGESLNTDYHEAIALVPAPNEEMKGKIMDCVQKGYTLNDKVIRHAKVVVGQ